MAINVSPGHLDSLMGLVIPFPDYTGISIQSFTTSSTNLSTATVTSVGVTDTGLAGPGLNPAQTITVVGVSDSQNTITLSMNSSSPFPFQSTDSVIGYAANSILVANGNSNLI